MAAQDDRLFGDEAFHVGRADLLYERQRGPDTAENTLADGSQRVEVPGSGVKRGLALTSLRVSRNWDGLWGLLGRRQRIYFLSVALDLSGQDPVVLPPKEVPESMTYAVSKGQTIAFTLGDGAPIFPPREITGGLLVYLIVCEADKGVRHVGEVMAKVHEDLSKDGSLVDKLTTLIQNPGAAVFDEVLRVAASALQPIATILKSQGDDFVGVFQGIYPAKGPWKGLAEEQDGTSIVLAELSA